MHCSTEVSGDTVSTGVMMSRTGVSLESARADHLAA